MFKKTTKINAVNTHLNSNHCIETTQDKKVETILTIVEEEIEEISDNWKDDKFVAELERRERSYLNGTAKTFTLDRVIVKARLAISAQNKSK